MFFDFLNIFARPHCCGNILKISNMKRFICFAAVASALALSACAPVDLTDHGRAPESIGPITVDRERIGTGQPFRATCVIPADGHNISSVEFYWSLASAAQQAAVSVRDVAAEPQVEAHDFTAPDTEGTYAVRCTARYVFGAPDTEGNVYRDMTCEETVRVEACDVLRSFWGDTMQETERNYAGLAAKGDDMLAGMVYDPFQYGSSEVVTGFRFSDGKLDRILQTEESAVSRGSGFYMYYLLLHHRITRGTTLGLVCDSTVVAWADGTTETPDAENDNKDKEKQERIDAGLASGEATITAVFHNDRYTLTLNVVKDGEHIAYDRTYSPRPAV